ncbi:unnamed protein product, partial [Nippostrongylus brasiliensis]|uniref:Protein male abnormal 7 (inferred by orthology to a C. elegans protein) n=1 Tax=Nippostrongylus brasiliensis TaxID=27835 RepID=A0A158QZG1_NIPBR
CQKTQQLIYKPFTFETCRVNPCQNDGKCIPGKLSCQCAQGWMGRFCHRKCRNIYKSCDRWAAEEKCHAILTQTNFFDVNCALACNLCRPDPDYIEPETPLPPALEPLQFLLGKWYSQVLTFSDFWHNIGFATFVFRRQKDSDFQPMSTPTNMRKFWMSKSWHGDDTRVIQGFVTLKPNSFPPEVAILSTSNEGLNMIELGVLKHSVLTMNVSYMQVHPTMDATVLPLGATRRFRRVGHLLEMTVAKLFPNSKVIQFKKMFKRITEYPV